MSLFQFIRKLFGCAASRSGIPERRPLALETLERREVYAGITLLSDRTLVLGDYNMPGGNVASVGVVAGGTIRAAVKQPSGLFEFREFAPWQVGQLIFQGGPLSDNFLNLTSRSSTMRGYDGGDRLIGGSGIDQIYGGDGANTIEGGGGSDILHGGSQFDIIRGGPGHDQIFGFGGVDFLYGNEDNDLIRGGDGDDFLQGHAGLDKLYGEMGRDELDGGGDNDLLFGGIMDYADVGNSIDKLIGGQGSDRILLDSGDTIVGESDPWDAEIRFKGNSETATVSTGVPKPMRFLTANWTNAEVEMVDEALAWLQDQTNNTSLLKTHSGENLEFKKVGAYLNYNANDGTDDANDRDTNNVGTTVLGWNSGEGEQIVLTRLGLTSGAVSVRNTVVHEIAHNWNSYLSTRVAGYAFWDRWLSLSGWRQSQNSAGTLTRSGDQMWWHSPTAVFATVQIGAGNYSQTNPFEDWATTFNLYYSYQQGLVSETVAQSMADKFAMVEELITAIRLRPSVRV